VKLGVDMNSSIRGISCSLLALAAVMAPVAAASAADEGRAPVAATSEAFVNTLEEKWDAAQP
jgi:hypothetical protein